MRKCIFKSKTLNRLFQQHQKDENAKKRQIRKNRTYHKSFQISKMYISHDKIAEILQYCVNVETSKYIQIISKIVNCFNVDSVMYIKVLHFFQTSDLVELNRELKLQMHIHNDTVVNVHYPLLCELLFIVKHVNFKPIVFFNVLHYLFLKTLQNS